jgi:hypothetical protein
MGDNRGPEPTAAIQYLFFLWKVLFFTEEDSRGPHFLKAQLLKT